MTPMVTMIPSTAAEDNIYKTGRPSTWETSLHGCVYVFYIYIHIEHMYIYIYKLVLKLVRSAKMIYCMGRRGARGRTGVFDGLTLIIHNNQG